MKIFLSWAEADAYIADPIAKILEADGHEVLRVGEDLSLEDALGRMSRATDEFDRMVALWSPAYFESEYGYAEMSAGLERDAMSGGGFLLPVMIETCAPPPPFDEMVAIDLRKFPDDISASGALLRALQVTDAAPDPTGAPEKQPSPGGDKSVLEEAFSKMMPEEILAHGDAMTGGGTGRAIPTLSITEGPLAEARDTYGDMHPEVAQRLLAYAEALYVNGRVEDADAAIREAAAIAETVGELPPHVQGRLVELVEKADRIAERGATSQDGGETADGDAEGDDVPLRETAPYHRDQAAKEDLLHRRSVANALGRIIDRVWAEDVSGDDDKSFVIHLHGPWGSGKSSILNFLREKLESGEVASRAGTDDHLDPAPNPPWLVVDYNAWRAQGRGPAWWSMMEAVYEATQRDLAKTDWRASRGIWFNHWLWRLRSGWIPALITAAITLIAVGLVFVFDPNIAEELKVIVPLIGLLASIFALQSGASFINTEKARQFVKLSRDPIRPLSRRYEALVEETRRPVAVFVDDLDRCEAEFVVEVLQSVQTLYRNARVAYVVAGDRDWICRSFQMGYADFGETVAATGRTLGHNFLEKIFQLSVEVPPITNAQRDRFWSLLLDAGEPDRRDVAEIRARVRERFDNVKTEADVESVIGEFQTSQLEAAIAGDEGADVMFSDKIRKEQEHFLSAYAKYLEPNPRSMKRLLNAYGFRRGFDLQSTRRTSADALARWTIFEMRWPLLAEKARRGEVDEALMGNAEARKVLGGLTKADLPHVFGWDGDGSPSAADTSRDIAEGTVSL